VRTIAISFAGEPIDLSLEGTVVLSSDPARETGAPLVPPLGPYEAVLLTAHP
jgi:hypothetical protein